MPEPPPVNLWTRWVLENPYPLGIGLLALGAVIFWLGLRDGRADRLRIAAIPALLGAAVLLTGIFTTTAGERARAVVRGFVAAVTGEDLVAASAMLAPDVRLHLASASNPAYRRGDLIDAMSWLAGTFDVTGNRVTNLDGFTEAADRATVHLACRTEVAAGYAPTPTEWVLEVEQQPDGSWQITRITFVSVMGEAPRGRWLR